MNKKELVGRLAKATSISQVKALEIVNALFDAEGGSGILVQELLGGEKITLPGFGTFGVKIRAARRGVNPSTNTHMQIVAKRHAYFKVGKNLKERILAQQDAASA